MSELRPTPLRLTDATPSGALVVMDQHPPDALAAGFVAANVTDTGSESFGDLDLGSAESDAGLAESVTSSEQQPFRPRTRYCHRHGDWDRERPPYVTPTRGGANAGQRPPLPRSRPPRAIPLPDLEPVIPNERDHFQRSLNEKLSRKELEIEALQRRSNAA